MNAAATLSKSPVLEVSLFNSAAGWCALAGRADCVHGFWFGHMSDAQVQRRISEVLGDADAWTPADWNPSLRERLQAYFAGEPDDFRDVRVELGQRTPFQQRVIAALRGIAFGRTIPYGELAALAGRPGAARAVGTVMSRNPIPIIIPCHRVVGAGGQLGGFSAPQGTTMKRRLLDLEAAQYATV